MKTPGRTTPESVGNVAETTTINEHPQIGTLILTLQELSTEFPDSDGDDLCCNYNELMFSKDFMAGIGKSRRANLVKTLLEFLHISFKGSGHSYTIYFPRSIRALAKMERRVSTPTLATSSCLWYLSWASAPTTVSTK